jgi:hypothetical protein
MDFIFFSAENVPEALTASFPLPRQIHFVFPRNMPAFSKGRN